MVGARGFEPPTPCSQGRCASQTALRPVNYKILDMRTKNQTSECCRKNTSVLHYLQVIPDILLFVTTGPRLPGS